MYLEEPATGKAAVPLPRFSSAVIVPALVCGALCIFLMRAGFFTLFFLVPLGVCAAVFGPVAAWLGAVCAALGNGVWLAGLSLRYGLFNAGLDTLYFAVLLLGFTWIMTGNAAFPSMPPVRTAFRFIAASAAGALVFLAMIFSLGNDEAFSAMLHSQIEAVTSAYIASSGADAAHQAFLEQLLTADRIIEVFLTIILRGGALFSAVFLFFFSRQMAFILARLFRRQGGSAGNSLTGFHAPHKTLMVLSLCLPVVLICRVIPLELVEIAAWNILVICATMFFFFCIGIVLFALSRRPLSLIMRVFCVLLVVCVIFSPGINVFAAGILILLGIAEYWLPLRVKKQETPDL
jgi:hypothetical protein